MAKTKMIGPYRCAFPSLDKPQSFKGGDGKEGKAKFKITLLIPKSDKSGLAEIQKFVKSAIDENGGWKAEIKKQVFNRAMKTVTEDGLNNNCLLRDGDELNKQRVLEDKAPYEFYKDNFVITCSRSADWAPAMVVNQKAKEILPALIASTIRPGYHVRAEVTPYVYDKPKPGISLTLQGVQFVAKDEEFGRQNNFTEVEGFDDDADETSEGFKD
jgi:hypothetical protein